MYIWEARFGVPIRTYRLDFEDDLSIADKLFPSGWVWSKGSSFGFWLRRCLTFLQESVHRDVVSRPTCQIWRSQRKLLEIDLIDLESTILLKTSSIFLMSFFTPL